MAAKGFKYHFSFAQHGIENKHLSKCHLSDCLMELSHLNKNTEVQKKKCQYSDRPKHTSLNVIVVSFMLGPVN